MASSRVSSGAVIFLGVCIILSACISRPARYSVVPSGILLDRYTGKVQYFCKGLRDDTCTKGEWADFSSEGDDF